jgi:hypothetical protein
MVWQRFEEEARQRWGMHVPNSSNPSEIRKLLKSLSVSVVYTDKIIGN